MALRWCAAGLIEASKQFRRVNGHLHLPALRSALERHVTAATIATDCNTQHVSAARCSPGRHQSSTGLGTSSRVEGSPRFVPRLVVVQLDK